jgi:hypothetical protein
LGGGGGEGEWRDCAGEYVKELGDRGGGERWKCDVESCVNAEPTGFGKEIV